MKLSVWRKARGLSLADLAERIGVTSVSLSRYERDERIPAREIMPKIVAETDGAVQPNDFYSEDDQAIAPPSTEEPKPPEELAEAS